MTHLHYQRLRMQVGCNRQSLKATRTIVLVTHNFAQARRVADWLRCLSVRDGAGEIAQSGCCADILSTPAAVRIDFRPS